MMAGAVVFEEVDTDSLLVKLVTTPTAGSGTHDLLLPTDARGSKSSVRNSSSSGSGSKRRRWQGGGAGLKMRIRHSRLQISPNNQQ